MTGRREQEPPQDGAPADPPRSAHRPRRRRSLLRELPVLVVVALVLSLVVKAWVVQAFYIPSGSMESTLAVGDRVLVDKVVYRLRDIRRGEVVVFDGRGSFVAAVPEPPSDGGSIGRALRTVAAATGVAPVPERDYIKRVIGLPGDRVRCCDERGRITVNDVPLTEPYLYPGDQPSSVNFDVEVPEGRLWVMGDHRSRSADSRAHLGDPGGGTVPVDEVIGRAFVIAWPAQRWGGLPAPETFDDAPLDEAAAVRP